jgi:hypothetical protein
MQTSKLPLAQSRVPINLSGCCSVPAERPIKARIKIVNNKWEAASEAVNEAVNEAKVREDVNEAKLREAVSEAEAASETNIVKVGKLRAEDLVVLEDEDKNAGRQHLCF